MKTQTALLTIENLSKGFPGVQALQNIDFTLYPEEIHCLVGENGAGKSTFIKILSGAISPDKGKISVFGNNYDRLTPSKSLDLGIQTVYQESVLVEYLSIAENIFLGSILLNSLGFYDKRKTIQEANDIIASFDVHIDAAKIVEELSTAEKQLVSIVKALSKNAKILILDEPTASLSSTEKNKLLNLLQKVKKNGIGVIYISHLLEEVFSIADRVTVLRDGLKINTHDSVELNEDELIREMVGRPASLFYSREEVSEYSGKDLHLRIEDYSRGEYVRNVSFEVRSGEIFGIGGMVGSGRTELARLLFGVDEKDSGRLVLNDKDITPTTPMDAIRDGLCLITEDRKKSGLVLVRSVKENIALGNLNVGANFFMNLKEEEKNVRTLVNRLRVATPTLDQEVTFLSGGNQQKVVLAKWMLTSAEIFIFDEPTRGVDIGAKEEIYRLITGLMSKKKIIILISSDMPELIAMSDRIGIMRRGELVKVLDKEQITDETILSYSIGVRE